MRDLKNYDGLHPIHVDALRISERSGWHVMSVFLRKDSGGKQEWLAIVNNIDDAMRMLCRMC